MKEVPLKVVKATSDLIDSCVIEIDADSDIKIDSVLSNKISEHNLELGSLIRTVSLEALLGLLIDKEIITKEEYQNNLYLKFIENKDTLESLALRAHTLRSAIDISSIK